MNAFTRSTRECQIADIHPDLAAAFRKHAEFYKMDDLESSALICCETISTRQKKGRFANGKETVTTGMLVTSKFLVWTSGEEKGKPVVLSALLRNISVQDFENTGMYRVAPDFGLNISGRYTDVTKQGQTFIGLGADPAGEKFRLILQHAIQRSQPG